MKLIDLKPYFYGAGGPGISNADGTPAEARSGVGMAFDCPCGCGSRCHIPFANPIDGRGQCGDDAKYGRAYWQRTGEDFATMTLTPSIKRIPHDGSCGWHGFITNGVIDTCGDSTPATADFIERMRRDNSDE